MRAAPRLLGRLQAHAVSLMVDACTITRSARGALNESTGVYATTTSTVYSGACRVQVRGAVAASSGTSSAPSVVTTSDTVEVHVPVSVTAVLPGDVVTVSASADPAAVGRSFVVSSVPTKTMATARRLLCEDSRS